MKLYDLINRLNAPVDAKVLATSTSGDAEQIHAIAGALAPVLARRLQAIAQLSAQTFSGVLSEIAAGEATAALLQVGGPDLARLSVLGNQALEDLMSDSTMQKAAIDRLAQQSQVERSQLLKDLPLVTSWVVAGLDQLASACEEHLEAERSAPSSWYSGLAERLGWERSGKAKRDPIESVLEGELSEAELRLFLPQTQLETAPSA